MTLCKDKVYNVVDKKERGRAMSERKTVYSVTSKKNWCATKLFDNLEDAIKWCDKQKTKLGHIVQHFDGCGVVRDYETFGNK